MRLKPVRSLEGPDSPRVPVAPGDRDLFGADALVLGEATRRLERVGAPFLRKVLVLVDAIAVTVAWSVALALPGIAPAIETPTAPRPVTLVLFIVAGTLALVGAMRLYLSRVCAVRAVEVARLARASALSVVVASLSSRWVDMSVPGVRLLVGGVLAFLLLASCRSLYTAWLKSARAAGRFSRPVVIVGSNEEGFQLYRLLHTHPEIGFRISGVIGTEAQIASWDNDVPWLGDVDDAIDAVKSSRANGVLIAASALTPVELNSLSRALLLEGVHVHISSGLQGINPRRLRSVPLAYEPLWYLEPATLSRWQFAAKRSLDIVLATLVLILVAPILALACVLIKLDDRGPVLFRQERVGRNAKPFKVLKLRTMTPDAEQRLDEVAAENQRAGGPLFKAESDPRRTRVGRWLEAVSLDEAPQLINVVRGEMSLVGPRPALASEVEQFDEELLERLSVPPGITGLWQAEARDNPAFYAYRRLDLFYVENWSVTLDLAIMLGTVRALLMRPFRTR